MYYIVLIQLTLLDMRPNTVKHKSLRTSIVVMRCSNVPPQLR